jgi:primosomal protein N' (replication factor Y)
MDTLFKLHIDEPDATHFVRIAVERRVELRSPTNDGLTYASPDPLNIGQRVEIPLGRGNTPATGVVVAAGGAELLDGYNPKKVKRIKAVLGSPLTPELVELGQWIARYYVAPLGMTLAGMIPAAVKTDTGRRNETRLELAADPAAELPKETKLTPTAKAAWLAIGKLSAVGWPMSARALADQIESKTVGPINRLVQAGLLIEVQYSSVKSRKLDSDSVFDAHTQLIPTHEQAQAIAGVTSALGSFSTHLLHGITGSGKTEVYLNLIETVLAQGKAAIMLVPEIALTPQTAGRVQSRFGAEQVAVLHSGLTAAQRNSAWATIHDGSAKVVVGARSAIFAPLENLGLIIVDEEHDNSYKQDQLPRYNARDVAIKRAHMASCPVLLGSATPSLESWANSQSKRSTLWSLPNRVGGGTLPRVQVVDMFDERQTYADLNHSAPPSELLVGPTLNNALERTLSQGGQAVLLLNKRGLAGFVGCCSSNCKWVLECDHCSARMVVHRFESVPQGGYVRCHHCGAEQIFPKQCPDCTSQLRQFGAGTQRAEEVVQEISLSMPKDCRLVAGDSLVRVDADTMRNGRELFETLARFTRGDIRVLLGTQMIAKGLDVPNVRLVGVLSADTALNLPDFRAGERTFQLVSQVAGRAGRGEFPGEVIVQTFEPDAPAIDLAAKHAYHQFASEELHLRNSVGLPPSRRMARIVCRDKNLAKAKEAANTIADAAADLIDKNSIRLMGPMPCPIERIADHFRIAIELSAPDSSTLQQAMHTLRAAGVLLGDSKTAVDVDPLALL